MLLGQDFDPSHSEGTADIFPSRDSESDLGMGGILKLVGFPHVSSALVLLDGSSGGFG